MTPPPSAPVVDLLVAGHTTAPGLLAVRGAGWRPRRFGSLVTVVRHRDGVLLVDTGYAPRALSATRRLPSRLYTTLLPVRVRPDETAAAQLAWLGLAAEDVGTVVVTHWHLDHVAGLADFPRARVVHGGAPLADWLGEPAWRATRRGLVPGVLPGDLAERLELAGERPVVAPDPLQGLLGPGHQLVGDGTVVAYALPGHQHGHLGVLVRTAPRPVLLVGDAVWGLATLQPEGRTGPGGRVATEDHAAAEDTVQRIRALQQAMPELLVVPSHDDAAVADARRVLGRPG